ncbi:epidermal growth factor-like protein [Diorhabda carinulata]|uniref:epidermal growth factor-like protein n=1 Tax=Diorhabda carinulata TaxID=1163345 RepID=UPI0025A2309F|nr:epidermal growth factor-like protein [Diorhabda carinulata]
MWHKVIISVSAIFAISLIFVDSAQLQGHSRGVLNQTRRGICTLEVPTIDLLSPEDRRGAIPRGNGSRTGYSKIEICCSGYEKVPHTHLLCHPVCDHCENGNCTSPGVCQCKRGWIHDDFHGDCIPTCPERCLNGVCTISGSCSCNAGNVLSANGKYCVPHCTGGCGLGGTCTGPEVCTCEAGYALDKKTNKCGYYCEGGCGEGTCIAPNQCSCKSGYKQIGHTCVPDCPRGCHNGECIEPNRCSCKTGWSLDNTGTVCSPHCNQPCLNGDCVAPNKCACKQGYIESPGSINSQTCVAHCPQGCPNGNCAAPNFCICNPGFVKRAKGSNECIRRSKRSVMHMDLIPEAVLKGF